MKRTPTRLHRLIDKLLDRPLADLVAERRAEAVGWRAIAAEVQQKTGAEISHQALIDWFTAETETERAA